MFFEHKGLYRSLTEDVPEDYYSIPIGSGKIIEQGTDLTIISYGKAVHWSKEICLEYKHKGISVEIIDLRSLVPWDKDMVEKSITKTNRVLIVHEANLSGGIGSEIAAYISENFFEFLDAPVVRAASLDTPVPFSEQIERDIYLPLSRIKEKINYLLDY